MLKPTFISFDVDGTLVHMPKFKRKTPTSFVSAFVDVFGKPDPKKYTHSHKLTSWMDMDTIENMMRATGNQPSPENFKKLQLRYEEIFKAHPQRFQTHPPGVDLVLSELNKMPNVTIGIATGNYPSIAWQKLERVGLAKYFKDRIGGYGLYKRKSDALRDAVTMAESLHHQRFNKIIHVGDLPDDIEAAKELGFIAVGVKTGKEGKNSKFPQGTIVLENFKEDYDMFMDIVKQ